MVYRACLCLTIKMRFGPWAPPQTNPFCCAIRRSPDENREQSLLRTASAITVQCAVRCAQAKINFDRIRMAAEISAIWNEISDRFDNDAVAGDAPDDTEYVTFLLPFSLQSVPIKINFQSPYPRKIK